MPTQKAIPIALCDLANGQEGDFFALMTLKEELKTREGKPYFKVGFRDSRRSVSFPVWSDSAWGEECRQSWTPGAYYKLRAQYRETSFGPQLEIRRIREVVEADSADGFEPTMFLPHTKFNTTELFNELRQIAAEKVVDPALSSLVLHILDTYREPLLTLPAATHNHHHFVGGYLEHVLSVTRNCVLLCEKYGHDYPDLKPPLNVSVAVAGAILHDIGKLREIEWRPQGAAYTPAGTLIGHILQGRDIVRETAVGRNIDSEALLRLEHIIVSHQRLPEWGSPKPPMFPEALIVHHSDDLDAKFAMMYAALGDDQAGGAFTSKQNPLYQQIYRGGGE